MKKKKTVFHWSGGKDSAHALWRLLQSDEYEVVGLLTTVNRSTVRSTMHNIPLDLLQAQGECLGLPLETVGLKPAGDLCDYSSAMEEAALRLKSQGITHFAFGDIFLSDVRGYREALFNPLGIEVVEPLWGLTSREVITAYLDSGLQAVVVTTMADGLGEAAIGRTLNREFIAALPEGMDPNGENGEYHTFCYDGPIFRKPVPFRLSAPRRQQFDIRLDDGSTQTFTYCFGDLEKA